MKIKHFILGMISLSCVAGCPKPVLPVETAPLVLPADIGPILVLVDHLPGEEDYLAKRAEQVAIGMRYFSAQTSWGYVDSEAMDEVRSANAIVYLGLNGNDPLPPNVLVRLRAARRLVVSRYHLSRLREAGIAFTHTKGGEDVLTPANALVRYKGQSFASVMPDLLSFKVQAPARVISDYSIAQSDGAQFPYIVRDGTALFINGEISYFSSDAARRGGMLTVCDALAQFFGATPSPSRPQAMLRLEDVSALTPEPQLEAIVHYLAAAHVPYGIGVIPELQVRGKTFGSLPDNRGLQKLLRWAEGNGATIVLHGLHHCCSSDGAEGYEFWDVDRNSPVSYDSAAWARSTIAEGKKAEIAMGLHPQLWETPHYSGSPVDYGVVTEFFSAAWELRRPVGWLPWVLRRDQYGVMLLPEDLGYVSLDRTKTVADQMTRAKEILVCPNCVAAGFLHPATVSISDVHAYVEGLRTLGYVFVDPGQAIREYGAKK